MERLGTRQTSLAKLQTVMCALRDRGVYFPSEREVVYIHPNDSVVLTCEVINFVSASAYVVCCLLEATSVVHAIIQTRLHC